MSYGASRDIATASWEIRSARRRSVCGKALHTPLNQQQNLNLAYFSYKPLLERMMLTKQGK